MPDFAAAASAIETFLTALGHHPDSDPELAETGRRVAEAFGNELLAGYTMDPSEILADTCQSTDEDGAVIVEGLHTTAICPHHLLPAIGRVHVAYLPAGKIVGLGALDRLVQCHARRLTLQEDLTRNIARSLVEHLDARAAGCVAELHQSCVAARGPRQAEARTITFSFAGKAQSELRPLLLAQLPRSR